MDWEREQGREGKERERGLGTGERKTVRERERQTEIEGDRETKKWFKACFERKRKGVIE